jgi:uncharacterized protein
VYDAGVAIRLRSKALMPQDDLHKPLGLGQVKPAKSRRFSGVVLLGFAAAAGVAGFAFLRGGSSTPDEPQAMAAIAPPTTPAPAAVTSAPAYTALPTKGSSDIIENATQVESASGVKVVRAGGGAAPDAMIIEVPQTRGEALAPAPDPRLVEKCRYGALPRIGDDGARPADVYARPIEMNLAAKADAPRIVIVVGGLGLSRAMTQDAIASLPADVTFAFAPYGHDLAASVADARSSGHEVILQIPMEPMDYPQTNPGPHVLLTSGSLADNTEDLHWLMSRFSGYVGIANFLGAKFTADIAHFAPVLQEIGERGLIYLDDGTSPQSVASTLAAQDNVPAAKADLILDQAPDGVDAALVKLEAIARDKGLAIGMASALPDSLEKIGRFARAAQSRGLALIPLSAAIAKGAPNMVDRGQ